MGGTGVGKSSLLNALAGGAIAQASFAAADDARSGRLLPRVGRSRPASIPPCSTCRLGAPRPAGAASTRSSSIRPTSTATTWPTARSCCSVLPVADVVLYVGSQEKYHDKLGWDMFLQQRQAAGLRLRAQQVGPLPARQRQRAAARRGPAHATSKARGFRTRCCSAPSAQYWVDQMADTRRAATSSRPKANSSSTWSAG